MITKCARALFLAYNRSDYDDPEGALASFVEVLSGYSDGIVLFVTDNKTGVQRRLKFPPRIAELVSACDEAAAGLEKRRRYQNWGKNEPLMLDAPQQAKPTLADLKAKYGENYGLEPAGPKKVQEFKAPSWDEITAMYQADTARMQRLMATDLGIFSEAAE